MRRNRRTNLGVFLGGLIAAVLAFGTATVVTAAANPGTTHDTAGVGFPGW
ncbi:hypothetical protein [Streptomyces sp. NPDC048106]